MSLSKLTVETAADVDDLVTSYGYDALGRTVNTTDPEGAISQTVFDRLGRVFQDKKPSDFAGSPITTTSSYDPRGRRTALVVWDFFGAGFETTSYEYDKVGRMTLTEYPDIDDVDFEYDLAGRLTSRTDQRAIELTYDYDDRGLLTRKYEAGGDIAETFAYDGLGRMTSALKGTDTDADAISETTLAYDDLSRLTSEDQELFEETTAKTLNYDYDQAGNRLTLLYEASGARSVQVFDRAARRAFVLSRLSRQSICSEGWAYVAYVGLVICERNRR